MAHLHDGATVGGVPGVQHDQAAVVDRAVRKGEAALQVTAQWSPEFRCRKAHIRRSFERAPAAEPIVEEEAKPDRPGGAEPVLIGQHETQPADQMRRDPEQPFALDQRLAHQAKLEILQITQAAVNQLAARRRRVMSQARLLDEQYAQPPTGRVAGDSGPVDAAADDEEIERCPRYSCSILHQALMRVMPGS